jgi:hypothetical protein
VSVVESSLKVDLRYKCPVIPSLYAAIFLIYRVIRRPVMSPRVRVLRLDTLELEYLTKSLRRHGRYLLSVLRSRVHSACVNIFFASFTLYHSFCPKWPPSTMSCLPRHTVGDYVRYVHGHFRSIRTHFKYLLDSMVTYFYGIDMTVGSGHQAGNESSHRPISKERRF